MSVLPEHPDLDQARRQAKELLRGAQGGDAGALARLAAVSAPLTLAGRRTGGNLPRRQQRAILMRTDM